MMKDKITYKGKDYLLKEWLTIAKYCQKHKISNTQTLTNAIRRGKVEKENILTISELNNLRLVKDINYDSL